MKTKIFHILMFISLVLVFLSCEKEDPNKPDLSEEVLTLNRWILKGLSDAYLWEDYMPDLDPEYQESPRKYFYDLLYSADRYSWIVDDYQAHEDFLNGISLTTGMSVIPALFTGKQVIFVVEYVTPDSPAKEANIDRGEIIYMIDGQIPDTTNYNDLFYQTTATFAFADWDGSDLIPNGKSKTITAIKFNENPIVHHEIIEIQGKKIGYLVYTRFTNGEENSWVQELDAVFEEFNSAGISDIVVDLRYNPGGSLDLSAYMASCLGPRTAMERAAVFVNLVWNDGYNKYWKDYDFDKDGQADGENSPQLIIKLPESDVNLDMSTIYFLTTKGTASASESLITGLYPYADVVQIGTATYGKPYGSVTIEDWAEPKRHTWRHGNPA